MGLRESKNLPALIAVGGSGIEESKNQSLWINTVHVDGFIFSRKLMFEICNHFEICI